FCLLMKRDRVSGDFFWHLDVGDMHFLAAVDCTGHGIPGALLSMIANEFLNNIVKEQHCYEPEDILMRLDMKLVESLHQNDNDLVRDGMDVSLCRIDGDRQRIVFSGACRPLFHFDGKEIIEIEGSKNSIGGLVRPDVEKLFGQQEIAYRPGDCIYLTSDGYASQFNHLTGKKLMKRGLVNELLAVATLEAEQQRLELKRYFLEWKGDDEQVDDVVIIGVKF
ncbi:MAG: SpoIIE family protein phosphatase, partial [Flavobacteriales bacterium]|nr:SpoIIE family protein phosphatase [Flavobacteriales bacterium]